MCSGMDAFCVRLSIGKLWFIHTYIHIYFDTLKSLKSPFSYRPDLIDYAATKDMSPVECNELSFAVLERELHIDRVMSAKQSLDLTELESRIWLNYLDQICDLFRGEIPHIKHPKMDFSDLRQKYRINHTHAQPDFSKLLATKPKAKSPMQDAVDIPTTVQRRSVLEEERAKRQRRHEQLLNIGGGAAGAAAGVAGSGTGTTTQGLLKITILHHSLMENKFRSGC